MGDSVTAGHPASSGPATVLAVDGGNSKTDVAIVDVDGHLLSRVRGPGFQPQLTGVPAAMASLGATVTEAASRAGRAAGRGDARQAGQETGGAPLVDQVAAFLAGADLPCEEEALREAVAAMGWGRSVHVANDAFALLRAGASQRWGIAVVCGAGINCVGLGPDGQTARFPALGALTGDWGGGDDLGMAALWSAVRGEDGRGPRTVLQEAIIEWYGMPTVLDVALAIHHGTRHRRDLRDLAPLVLRAAGEADQVADGLVARLAEEVCRMATVAMGRLLLLGSDVEVVLGGGVLASAHPSLHSHLNRAFQERAPLARLTTLTAPPVLGAALAGLDRLAASDAAGEELRLAIT